MGVLSSSYCFVTSLPSKAYRFCFLPAELTRTGYPNFDQVSLATDEKMQKTICAPAAALNAVYHINNEQKFLPDFKADDKEYARKTMQDLATALNTREAGSTDPLGPGTTPEEVIKGIPKFFEKFGKKLKFWDWRGWGAGQVESGTIDKAPRFNWIAKHLKNTHREVLLHVGMYKKIAEHKFKRVFGHFVTATGFKKKNLEIKINDPSPRANDLSKPDAARPEKILKTKIMTEGTLESGDKNTSAYGYNQLEGMDLNTDVGAEIAVIDGAYAFEV